MSSSRRLHNTVDTKGQAATGVKSALKTALPSPLEVGAVPTQRLKHELLSRRLVSLQRSFGNRAVIQLLNQSAYHGLQRQESESKQSASHPSATEMANAAVVATVPAQGTAVAPSSSQTKSQVELDAAVRARLEEFLAAFQNIPVRVRWEENSVKQEALIHVRPPYFINSRRLAGSKMRFDKAVANRMADTGKKNTAPVATTQQDLLGKTTPHNLATILQSAVDNKKVPFPAGQKHPNAEDLRKWLVTYGIGIDCSGFVSQALNLVMEDLVGRDAAGTLPTPIALGSKGLKGGTKNFVQVAQPKDLRPGDTMWLEGHIRIVTSVSVGATEVQFATAESTAARSDIGPTSKQWRYPNPEQFSKLQKLVNSHWKEATGESGIFGRYNASAQAKPGLEQGKDRKRQRVLRQNKRYGAALGWQQMTGAIVEFFQGRGYLPPDKIPDATHFAAAVEDYQRATRSLAVDGILGFRTWRSLQAAIAGNRSRANSRDNAAPSRKEGRQVQRAATKWRPMPQREVRNHARAQHHYRATIVGHALNLQGVIGNRRVGRFLEFAPLPIQRQGTGSGAAARVAFPWSGQIHNTWSAALRATPNRGANDLYRGIRADLSRGTRVTVLGRTRGWLHVKVTEQPEISGYVAQELVKSVGSSRQKFEEGEKSVREVNTMSKAFVILKRAELSKAHDPYHAFTDEEINQIKLATNQLERTQKYTVDSSSYQVSFKHNWGQKTKITTIEDFILFVETVERSYPNAQPAAIASEIRQLWFSDHNWDVLVASRGIAEISATGKKVVVDIESEPNALAKQFDMRDLAPRSGGKKIMTAMGVVDIGHVLAGIDAALSCLPAKNPADSRKFREHETSIFKLKSTVMYNTLSSASSGDVRDFTTWAGDLGQAYAEFLIERYVKNPATNPPGLGTYKKLADFVNVKASDAQLLGDIHGYIAVEVSQRIPASSTPTGIKRKVSDILRDLYLVRRQQPGLGHSYESYFSAVGGTSTNALAAFVNNRVARFARLWYARELYRHIGYWKIKGWLPETVIDSAQKKYDAVHALNEKQAAAEDRLSGLCKRFLQTLKVQMP